jgi:hypothetical protein
VAHELGIREINYQNLSREFAQLKYDRVAAAEFALTHFANWAMQTK